MSEQVATKKKFDNNKPRASRRAIKEQQNLRSWYEFHTRLSNGGTLNKIAAEKCRAQITHLEEVNPLLYPTSFK